MAIGVKTNNVAVSIAAESAVGTKPTTGWTKVPVNDVDPGVEIATVDSTPLGSGRMHLKGSPVGLSSKFALDMDVNMSVLKTLLPFAFNVVPTVAYGGLAAGAPFYPTAVTSTEYTVGAGGALATGALVRARGFAISGNNGVKKVGSSSTNVAIKTSGLAAETTSGLSDGSRGATVEVCGVEGAAGDVTVASSTTIASTLLDFSTLGLKPGQWLGVGDPDSGAAYKFDTSGNGMCRISAIAAHLIAFDITIPTLAVDTAAAKTIRLLFGPWLRDVADTDAAFNFVSFSAEVRWPNLYPPNPGFEYPVGVFIDELDITIPVKSKGGMKAACIGTDNAGPTNSQASGASAAHGAQGTTLVNTSSDIAQLVTKDASTTVITYWKTLTLKLKNNLKPLDVVGSFAAIDVNYGFLDATVDGSGIFDSSAASSAIRNNDTCKWYALMKNTDGGVMFDVPSLTFGGGKRTLTRNEEVDVALTGTAFKDDTLGYQVSASIFPYLSSY